MGGFAGCSFGALEAGSNGAVADLSGGGDADKGFSCGETLEDESARGSAGTGGGTLTIDVSPPKGSGDCGEKLGTSAVMGGGGDGILK
jgi:hypothetical protein